MTAQENSGLA
jgi:hypothetical protein